MEAAEFIRTLQELCEGKGCDDCPFHDIDRCDVRYVEDPEETVRIVEEWEKEQDRQKQEQEQHKTEQERRKLEYPEESSDLHAIIDELEYRIDKLEKKVSNEALIFREVSKRNQGSHRKLADRIAALEEYHVESMNEQKRTNMDALLAAFPNARMDNDGIPYACPNRLDAHYNCDKFENCLRCRHTHWLAEIEEK